MIIAKRDMPDGVCIVDLKGKLTILDGAAPLRDYVQTQVDQGCRKLLLNLRELSHIDSSGIGSIVASYTLLSRSKGDLKLLGGDQKIRMLLSALESFDNEREALASFTSSAGE